MARRTKFSSKPSGEGFRAVSSAANILPLEKLESLSAFQGIRNADPLLENVMDRQRMLVEAVSSALLPEGLDGPDKTILRRHYGKDIHKIRDDYNKFSQFVEQEYPYFARHLDELRNNPSHSFNRNFNTIVEEFNKQNPKNKIVVERPQGRFRFVQGKNQYVVELNDLLPHDPSKSNYIQLVDNGPKTERSVKRKCEQPFYKPHTITDVCRIKLVVNSNQTADDIVHALAHNGYQITDKDWKMLNYHYMKRSVKILIGGEIEDPISKGVRGKGRKDKPTLLNHLCDIQIVPFELEKASDITHRIYDLQRALPNRDCDVSDGQRRAIYEAYEDVVNALGLYVQNDLPSVSYDEFCKQETLDEIRGKLVETARAINEQAMEKMKDSDLYPIYRRELEEMKKKAKGADRTRE